MAPGAPIVRNPHSKIQTCSQQLVASLQTFTAGIMGNKTHPVTLQLMRPPSKHCSDQVLGAFSAGVQGKGFSHVLNCNWDTQQSCSCKGAILRHSREEPLPKDRNSRVMQVFGAYGKVQSARNREYVPPVQTRDKNTSRKQLTSSFHRSSFLLQPLNLPARAGPTFWVALGH